MTKEELLKITEEVKGNGDNYRELLYAVAKAMNCKSIVELGTYMGITAKGLAMACPEADVMTCDSWSDSIEFVRIKPNNLTYVRGDGRDVGRNWLGEVDLLFIDVEHTYENTIGCYNAWKDHVRQGGIIFFDDTEFDAMKQVKEELKDKLIILNQYHNSGFICIIK